MCRRGQGQSDESENTRQNGHSPFIVFFLVSGRDLACQQEVSLALTKTPPIHY